MKLFLPVFFFLTWEAVFSGATCLAGCGCCDSLGIRLYEELGCEGVYTGGKTCPDYFTCPQYSTGTDYCMFGGRHYKVGQWINSTSPCKHCKCKRKLKDGNIVGIVDCYNHESCEDFTTDACNNIYDIDSCCPIGSHCSELQNTDFECQHDGICYKEGEKFYPEDSCYECVCGRGFEGRYEAPHCVRKRCDIEVNYADEIHRKCAPVYPQPKLAGVHGALCCPHRFICPEQNCNVEVIHTGETDCQKCYWGDRAFAINSTFYIHSSNYQGSATAVCSCTTPPLLTCVGN